MAAAALVGAQQAQSAPLLRGATQAKTSAAVTSFKIARPAGLVAGDVQLAVVTVNLHISQSITPPTGWRFVRRDGTAAGTSTPLSQALYSRVAGQLEPPSYTWRFGKSTGATGAILAYGGVDQTAPVIDHSGRAQSYASLIVAPTVAAPWAPTAALGFFGTAGVSRFTPPTGMTERHEISAGGSRSPARRAPSSR